MLRSPPKPLPLRLALKLYEFSASLKLAVVLIFSLAIVLAVATFVESEYGLRAVHFAIYGAGWFTLLGFLLALNIFCAALIRYPWKRHQTGFVITHLGLLTLLFGCLLSRRGGIDAQMPIFEGGMNHRAFEDTQHFELTIHPVAAGGAVDRDAMVDTVIIPFHGGPFNWHELEQLRRVPKLELDSLGSVASWAARTAMIPIWRLARPDAGVLYDQDGIQLEVLDFYSHSEEVSAPLIDLKITNPRMARGFDESGREKLEDESFSSLRLGITSSPPALRSTRPYGIGERKRMGGGSFVFWLAGDERQQQAFLESRPQGELGEQGQVVLFAEGKKFTFDVHDKLDAGRFPLGDTGLEAELTGFFGTASPKPGSDPGQLELIDSTPPGSDPESPAVEIMVYRSEEEEPRRLVFFADIPELDLHDYATGVFGTYWYDYGEKTAEQRMQGEGGSRIDIIQGADERLYYRYWNGHEVVSLGELPGDGERVDAFKMPIAQLQMFVERHVSAPRPERKVMPVPFDKDMIATAANRAAKVRLTVDGHRDEFWIVGRPPAPFSGNPTPLSRQVASSDTRHVSLTMPLDEVDIGFKVRLQQFERKLDPGTSQASHFGSVVDFFDKADDGRGERRNVLMEDVRISMNAPVDFSDPVKKRSYRLFQEAFRGPFPAGSSIYEEHARDRERDQLYLSILTVNYDPGRGIKYLGSLLVVLGIVTMFYMRAYFFKRPEPRGSASGN